MPVKEYDVCGNVKWIDVVEPSQNEINELTQKYSLNPFVIRDCLQPEHLPKYEFVDDVHFLILRYYAHTADKRIATIQDLTNKIAIFYTERFIITIHAAKTQFIETIEKKFVSKGRCSSTTSVLAKLVWNALESFDDPVNRLSEQVDFFESQLILKKPAMIIQKISFILNGRPLFRIKF